MQSTFSGLNTMVNGIFTNRLGLNTVGHNISNSNTEGYSRQRANAAAVISSEVYTLSGPSRVGNGSTVTAVIRARDIYADRQFWKENSTNGYYNGKASNYAKIEAIFNDSDNTGIQNAMEKFYQAWQDCSTNASIDTNRQNVINMGQNFAQSLRTAAQQVQGQITSLYDDITLNVETMNRLMDQMVDLNKQISGIEATGAHANDLRDQRDLIVDELTNLTNIAVYEDENGMYTLVSDGTTLVNGISRVDLEMTPPRNNKEYGISDYDIIIKQTGTVYSPGGGELKAQFEGIADDKAYIDELASMATFLLTTLNDQHKAGYGIDGDKNKPYGNTNPKDNATTGLNFYGESNYTFEWNDTDGLTMTDTANNTQERLKGIKILDLLEVNSELTEVDGHKKLATRSGERASDMVKTGVTFYETTTPGVYTTNINDPNIVTGPVAVDLGDKLVYTVTTAGTPPIIRYTTDTALADQDGNGHPLPVDVNGTGDGSNAVWIAALFNCERDMTSPEVNGVERCIGNGSMNSYYNTSMTSMGSATANMNGRVAYQANVMSQVENLRSSTSGVNWDEELTNMIMFQQGYASCSRCLTAMDECLEKLINGTGMVGR